MNKKELVRYIAEKLNSFGYEVYISGDKRYGFYTDGYRVVCFGGHWEDYVDFSGNYSRSAGCGTGWQIAAEKYDITREEAEQMIKSNAPMWTGNKTPVYTTPYQHLKMYGDSSKYVKFDDAYGISEGEK